ncbi:ABC transporter permease [Micromonospora aurantiaca]|uniref:ABC transporter permease n=1 Tax=Micromonospora TaxID=1873 RepID=UPI0001C47660|nr:MULTISPECIES: ABC transporter permease [Micromonospora]ADU10782.1 binding-protein-dependent transport systems inner membrane component [Micromonospora sp. L5]MBC9002666.1 ABC transporter permease [Micromonospora aurantiaca]MDG4751555.1 ABC transporter permease [Micromonospora sp. WMMD718]OHX02371.1 glutathione ABC transporter permease GsiC [Micromonospora sp. WMMB235]RNI02893.1 ABC transporter permease [Micromonospora aurantiaca]
MARFVLRRVLQSAVVLVGVTLVVFLLLQLVPGDPVRVALGTRFDPQTYEALRERAGLDQPLPVQYASYLGHALTGDLGVSFRTGQPVSQIVLERLPATLSLAVTAVVFALLVAFPLGIVAAVRSGSAVDHAARVFSQFGVSVPDFWMGIMGILLFAGVLGWLPPSGYVALTDDPGRWATHVALPAVTVGLVTASILTRFIRSSVLEVLSADYVRTAEAKGLRNRVVIVRHVLRNALIPVVTVVAVQLASLLGGVIVIEVLFAWPGIGRLTFDAVQARDYPVLQGAVLLVAALFLLVNLLVDILYARLDPRITVK